MALSSDSLSNALVSEHNLFTPNVKVWPEKSCSKKIGMIKQFFRDAYLGNGLLYQENVCSSAKKVAYERSMHMFSSNRFSFTHLNLTKNMRFSFLPPTGESFGVTCWS